MRHMDANGEYAGPPTEPAEVAIPDNLRWLWRLERSHRREAHKGARQRFEWLTAKFGQGDGYQAYFALPIESGKRRVLLATSNDGYHIILNDETIEVPSGSRLHYAEWALDPDKCLTGFRESTARRADRATGWNAAIDGEAFLFAYNGSLRVLRGGSNALVSPPERWYPTGMEMLSMSRHLGSLNMVLSGLTPAMHEPLEGEVRLA